METQKIFAKRALAYHSDSRAGKLATQLTKPLNDLDDLALAYSPGVAEPCKEIARNPGLVSSYTNRGNLVGVVTNGSAVLGLGDIGPLASKPVMEGKSALFKKFGDIDSFDIEINEKDPHELAKIICSLEPTFAAINLEDIKAPDCYVVEDICNRNMNIPVFHDDQHGTAVVVTAAVLNATKLSGRDIRNLKIVTMGAGAAGLACMNMLVKFGVDRRNISVFDKNGVLHSGRHDLFEQQKPFAKLHGALSVEEAFQNVDMFLGLAGANLVSKSMISAMADQPIVFALANPTPEIWPEDVLSVKPDAFIATGRSDYPNQVNNALCFPFLFRGVLDSGAATITWSMLKACVEKLADIGLASLKSARSEIDISNSRPLLLPDLFDPKLRQLSAAVKNAAR